MKAIPLHEYGGPEVLKYEDAPRPEPAAGDGLICVRSQPEWTTISLAEVITSGALLSEQRRLAQAEGGDPSS